MIDINKKYRTRCGSEVRIYATDGSGRKSVHGAYFDTFVKGWISLVWTEHGKVDGYQDLQPLDLIEVRPRHKWTVWLNIYGPESFTSHISREQAEDEHDENRIACIKVDLDFEEGEGL
jgi:hypothetical protein